MKKLPVQYDFLFKIFKFGSIDPFEITWKRWLGNAFALTIGTYVMVFNLTEITAEYKGVETIGKSVFTPCILNKYLQYVVFAFGYKAVAKPFHVMQDFWPWDKFGTAVSKRLDVYSDRCYFIMKFYFWLVVVNAIPMSVWPAFHGTLFYFQYDYCDMANNMPCYVFSYTVQIVGLIQMQLPAMFSFDLMYIAFIGHIYNQFELLKVALAQIQPGMNARAAIKEIVDQHNVIIEFIQSYDSWTSLIFLVKYMNITGQLICSLYMITIDEFPPSIERMQTFGVLLMTMFLMGFIYSFGGAVIKDQSLSVADAAYSMRWDGKGQTSLRKDAALIILRSQMPVLLSAGHITITMETFITVMQTVVSVYGLLATLAENEALSAVEAA